MGAGENAVSGGTAIGSANISKGTGNSKNSVHIAILDGSVKGDSMYTGWSSMTLLFISN
jgi:hypothetical protein